MVCSKSSPGAFEFQEAADGATGSHSILHHRRVSVRVREVPGHENHSDAVNNAGAVLALFRVRLDLGDTDTAVGVTAFDSSTPDGARDSVEAVSGCRLTTASDP